MTNGPIGLGLIIAKCVRSAAAAGMVEGASLFVDRALFPVGRPRPDEVNQDCPNCDGQPVLKFNTENGGISSQKLGNLVPGGTYHVVCTDDLRINSL